MSGSIAFFIPAVIFLGLVVPLWLVLHYIVKWRNSRGLSEQEQQQLAQAMQEVARLEDRVETLETILDAEQPTWRERYSAK